MNHNSPPRYQIRNARNEVCAPISLEELRKWVDEGRVGDADRITQVGSGVWGKKQDFPELGYNAAAARSVIDAELAKTKRVRFVLGLSFILPAAIAIALFALPSYDASEQIRLERQAASQARIEAIKATDKMKAAQAEAQTAKRLQDDSERLAKALQEANERLKSDIRNAAMIAETLKGGTEERSKILAALESQIRRAEAAASKGRIDNLELSQKLSRAQESEAALNKEVSELKAQLDAELKKSIVQKVFESK